MAHAALLTPLETSDGSSYLGVIMPAANKGHQQGGPPSSASAAEPCAQSAQLDMAGSPSPSPYPEPSPGATGTPKSARRRKSLPRCNLIMRACHCHVQSHTYTVLRGSMHNKCIALPSCHSPMTL
eukprot:scaffold191051_cov23-Prasinocladus_malaysianus.AAC.1